MIGVHGAALVRCHRLVTGAEGPASSPRRAADRAEDGAPTGHLGADNVRVLFDADALVLGDDLRAEEQDHAGHFQAEQRDDCGSE